MSNLFIMHSSQDGAFVRELRQTFGCHHLDGVVMAGWLIQSERAPPLRLHVEACRDTGLVDTPRLCYPAAMKMTFAIPDDLGRRFRKAVPPGERSAVVAEVLRKKLRPSGRELAAVCRRVNQLTGLEKDLAGWEQFDDQDA